MDEVEAAFQAAVEREIGPDHYHRAFALARYTEGARALGYLTTTYRRHFPRGARVLDVGGGNGGFVLPFAERGFHCLWTDWYVPHTLTDVVRRTNVRVERILASADRLPLCGNSIDVVLYVETIEHVDALAAGGEISRVLRHGGICYITSPPRFRFLGRDPHYGIRGLLMLPDSMQQRVFRLMRPNAAYEVQHVFWSAAGIMRTLPGLRPREITSKHFSGPLRRLDWDWIVAVKS